MTWVTAGMRGPSRYWHRLESYRRIACPLIPVARNYQGDESPTRFSVTYANTMCGAMIGSFAGVLASTADVPPAEVVAEGKRHRRTLCLKCVAADGALE